MTFKLIDAAIAIAKERAETLKYKVRNCKSQQELDNLRVDLIKLEHRIQDLSHKKATILSQKYSETFGNV